MSRLIIIPPRKAAPPPDPDLMLWFAGWKESYSNNTRITTIHDWSGNAHDMSAPNTADRPRFDTGVLNSQPGFWFGGDADKNFVRSLSGYMPSGTEAELIVVIKKPGTESGNGWMKFDGGGWAAHITFGGTIYETFGTQDRTNYTPTYSQLTAGAVHHVQVKSGSSNFKVWLNGNVLKTQNTSAIKWSNQTAGTTYYQVGASSSSDKADTQTNWYHGHILELKLWKRLLTATERNAELAAINSRYGISYTPF